MTFRTQCIKCILSVILCSAVCVFLLNITSFYLINRPQTIFLINKNQMEQYPVIPQTVTKPVNLEIKFSEQVEMNSYSDNSVKSIVVLQQISNVCSKYNLKTPPKQRHFLYNSKHKSLYCWIRKIASTSFTKLFSDMENRQITRNYYREVNVLAPKTLKELQLIANDTKTFKLLIVRHPFQRLVSSYRDRIEDNSKHTAQAWIYTKKIFRLTRPELFHSNITTGNFLKKIFTADKRLKLVPTFKEFSEWLVQNSEDDDVHWNQYYSHCAVCNIRYNYVLRLDDYTYEQIDYIFSKFGLDTNKVYLPKLEQTRNGYTDFRTACKYFGNLTQSIILRLYNKYNIDFEMYNYNLHPYLFCANKQI